MLLLYRRINIKLFNFGNRYSTLCLFNKVDITYSTILLLLQHMYITKKYSQLKINTNNVYYTQDLTYSVQVDQRNVTVSLKIKS